MQVPLGCMTGVLLEPRFWPVTGTFPSTPLPRTCRSHPLPTQSTKAMLDFMRSVHRGLRASLLVIVMVPLFAWAQDSPSREQAIRPMHVQKKTERLSNGRLKIEY